MSAEKNFTPSGMKPWLRLLLVMSLGLNLVVIFMVVGALTFGERWHPPHAHKSGIGSGGPLAQALSREDRRAIGRSMRQSYEGGSHPKARTHENFRAFAALLKQNTFDVSAAAELLMKHRSHFTKRLELGQKLLLVRLSEMTSEERAAYAERLLDAIERDEEKRRHHKWKDAG